MLVNSILTQEEQQTIQYYDIHGQKWSDEHSDTSFWKQEIDAFSKLLPTGNLLELGVGSGKEAYHLIKHGYHYTGIDLSETFLELARKHNPGAHLLNASLYSLPFQPNTFDGFWAAAVFLHVPKKRIDEAFEALRTVLKPGAIGFIALKKGQGESLDELGRFFAYYTDEEWKCVLAKHNFVVVQESSIAVAERVNVHTWLCFWVKYQV